MTEHLNYLAQHKDDEQFQVKEIAGKLQVRIPTETAGYKFVMFRPVRSGSGWKVELINDGKRITTMHSDDEQNKNNNALVAYAKSMGYSVDMVIKASHRAKEYFKNKNG